MSRQSNLFLFLVIATILLTSSFTSGTAFAANNGNNKNTFDEMCAKKKGNEPDALFCQAILGLQQSTNSFFDIFTEIRLVDTHLQNQIDSFFDIFVELDDVADKQCLPGTFASGTNLDGSLICTDIAQNQDCDDGFYMSGIDDDGTIKCKPLPSGSNLFCGDDIVTSPETCDDGNTVNGDSCSAICTIETTDLCLGVNTDDENQCTIDACNSSTGTATHTNSPAGTACNTSGGDSCDSAGSCVVTSVCGDGVREDSESCDDGNSQSGDGCNASCQVETGFSCADSPSTCSAVCGDGIIVGAEQCDGADLGAQSCPDNGFSSGTLSCSSSCIIDTSACVDTLAGVFSVNPIIDYQCADFGIGPLININTSQLVVTHDVSTDDVTVFGLPVILHGSATSSGFSASGTISGSCTETYQLDASFTNADTFSGTLSLSFSGTSCMDCTNQIFLVTGTRSN